MSPRALKASPDLHQFDNPPTYVILYLGSIFLIIVRKIGRTGVNEKKFLSIVLLLFSFVIVTNGLAFAERECTHQVVVNPDGTKTIIINCSSSYTKTQAPGAENFRDRYFFNTLVNNLMDNVNRGLQNFQDRTADRSSIQVKTYQIAADSREKEREAIDAERTKQQEQKTKLENSKH